MLKAAYEGGVIVLVPRPIYLEAGEWTIVGKINEFACSNGYQIT